MTQNLRGALLMILAMALFAIEDMCIKLLSSDMSTGQIIAILGGGGAVLVGLVALLRDSASGRGRFCTRPSSGALWQRFLAPSALSPPSP